MNWSFQKFIENAINFSFICYISELLLLGWKWFASFKLKQFLHIFYQRFSQKSCVGKSFQLLPDNSRHNFAKINVLSYFRKQQLADKIVFLLNIDQESMLSSNFFSFKKQYINYTTFWLLPTKLLFVVKLIYWQVNSSLMYCPLSNWWPMVLFSMVQSVTDMDVENFWKNVGV